MEVDREFLETKIGISERRVAGPEESSTDMACQAVARLLQLNSIPPASIGLLVVCTQSPDYRLPTTACLVQHRSGLPTSCLAFDVNLGCSGYVYCLTLISACLRAGMARDALLVTVDQYSKLLDPRDKHTASIFGDAASCTWLGDSSAPGGLIDWELGTDGSGALSLIAHNSGVVRDSAKSSFLQMNGRDIFKFSIEAVPQCVNRLLARNQLGVDQISLFVFHQANRYMLREIQKRMGISDEQMLIDLQYTGNTVSSSIPIALECRLASQPLPAGSRVVLCGFGVGLSWGSVLYTV
jgi:3-oxoacyl-[acyl-carrier-protein] synthase-3